MAKEEFVNLLLERIAKNLNGTPDFTSDQEGVRCSVTFQTIDDAHAGIITKMLPSELERQYPNGFHILRVHEVRSQQFRDPVIGDHTATYVTLEILAKQPDEKSAAEKQEDADLKKRLLAEKELEEESLVLDSLENGIVDLIRACDDTIKPFAEMSDAKKKVIRSHLNTLQALMRL